LTRLKVANWKKWQSYRSDRSQPPWIKVHRCVMRNPEWVSLNDAQRGQLVAIWLLAADKDGVIPASPQMIRKLCFMDSDPDLQLFAELGFIESDANLTPERRQADAEVTTQTRLDKTRLEENTLSDSATPKPDHAPTKEIISHLNQKAGTSFRASSKKTQTLIKARMREGYAVEDFVAVIDRKVEEWRGTEMAQYLRPETLFGPKFESYRNGIGGGKHGEEQQKLDRAIIEELKFQLSENGPTGAAEWIDRQKPALQNALIDMVGRLPK
jgi:uncharacterized phage protein (TIGR02220 family)